MKIKKLLPLLAAAMLVTPAFAAVGDPVTTTQTITVPKFINITKESSVETANASFTDDYSTINLDVAMNSVFKVITNNPDDCVSLTGTALAGGSQHNALYGDADALKLIFTNQGDGARAAAESALTSIVAGPTNVADNANAIAFTLGTAIDPSGAASSAPTAGKEGSGDTTVIKYPIQNGIYLFTYTLGQTAEANTFSTHDTNGTYKATLTLSQCSR